ncbi:unnamed protein product [Symbiodinium natans]|uniref:Uncharacterized protein n=1 Tax=Symbiodinium natans TaxID=878477 RepID=A0A812UTF4_9DINO|nr:unnamed protein product [Symbiodinium natans]
MGALPVRHDAAWVCPACARDVRLPDVPVPAQAGELCGGCGNQLRWEYDMATARGRFHFSSGCARPTEARAARGPTMQPAAPPSGPAAPRPAVGYWLSRGPPAGEIRERTNSWLYVPLLQAAAGDLLFACGGGLEGRPADQRLVVAETARGTAAAGLLPPGPSMVPSLEAVLSLADCAGPGLPPLRP